MSNFLNMQVVAAEALDSLDYNLVAGSLIYRDKSESFSSVRGMKVGQAVTIQTATDLVTTEFTGQTETQEVNESGTQLTIEKHLDVSVKIGAKERALNLDGVREQIVNPAMISLAQKADTYLLSKLYTGSQGLFVSPNLLIGAKEIAEARRYANLQQIKKGNRIGLVNDELEVDLLGQDAFTKFDNRGEPAVSALERAAMGTLMGIDWFSSENMPVEVRTPVAATGVLDNSVATSNIQGGSFLITTATTGTFTAGDKIEIAGARRAFTVAVTAAAGATSIQLVEQINENLSTLDGAAITVISAGVAVDYQGVILNPNAFGFAAPPLDPADSEKAGVASAEGMSIRVTEAYDWKTKNTYWSFDMLIGAAAIDARLSTVLGKS